MKFYILFACISAQILFASPRILPSKFPPFCSQSTPNYNECMIKHFHQIGPMLLKGVREINFPKLHPLEVVSFSINRSLNEYVNIAATIKNMQNWGFDLARLESFEFDPKTLEGKIGLVTPSLKTKMEFEVDGNILGNHIDSSGLFASDASNLRLLFTFKLKKIEKIGVEYYTFENFVGKSTFDDIDIKLTTNNPEFQPMVDSIQNFYNQDHKRLQDAIDPVYQEAFQTFYRGLAEKVLESIPAKELIPE